jgi:hypothetical protein
MPTLLGLVVRRMRLDAGFVSSFIAGLLFVSAGVAGVLTGKHITMGRITSIGPEFVRRKESPTIFWLHVALFVGGGTLLQLFAFIHALSV